MTSIIKQVVGTFIICTICVNFSLMFAWPSTTLKLFGSSNTTLNRPMTETELALFGSLSSVAALVSTPISGFLLDYLGRKYCIIIFSLPQILAWTLVIVSRRVETVLIARFIAGLGGCLFNLTPVYISEICHEKIRGTMTACSIIFFGIGILVSYILGGCLSFDMMNYACLTLSVAGILLLTLIKESPTYLMKKGLDKEAASAIAYYRETKPNSKEVLDEMALITKTLNPDVEHDFSEEAPENEKLNSILETPKKPGLVQFIKKSKSTRKGLFIIVVLYALSLMQGLVAVQVYAEPVFQAAMPAVSPTVLSVAFAIVNIIVGFVAAYLTDLTGRRPLMIYSSLATGVCCVLLGSQFQLNWGPHWLSGVFIYAFCVFYTAGAGTIPYVIVADLFLPEVRSVMAMAAVEWSWICSFVLLFLFNPLVAAIGLGCVFYVFAAICFSAVVFSYIYMPETKGLTVDVVQTVLMKKR